MRNKLNDNRASIGKGEIKEKINFKGLAAIIIAFLLTTTVFYLFVSTESSKVVVGKVVMLNDTTSDSGATQWLVVELEDGRNIHVKLPNSAPFKKNKEVKLIETKTKLFGAVKYRFAGYQE